MSTFLGNEGYGESCPACLSSGQAIKIAEDEKAYYKKLYKMGSHRYYCLAASERYLLLYHDMATLEKKPRL